MSEIVNTTGARSGIVGTTEDLTNISIWFLTSSITAGTTATTALTANLSVSPSFKGYVTKGPLPTVSSGVFTFPSTGYWEVASAFSLKQNSGHYKGGFGILSTDDNSVYSITGSGGWITHSGEGTNSYDTVRGLTYLKVSDTANIKVKFYYFMQIFSGDDLTIDGRSAMSDAGTQFYFKRLGSL